MIDLIIKNGTIVGLNQIYKGNIYIKDGKITAISEEYLDMESNDILDATDMMVFPGGIDAHAHLNDPGYNQREDLFMVQRLLQLAALQQ